jgi:hypothetical protein
MYNLSLKVFIDGQLTKRITNAQRLNDSEVYVTYFFWFMIVYDIFFLLIYLINYSPRY